MFAIVMRDRFSNLIGVDDLRSVQDAKPVRDAAAELEYLDTGLVFLRFRVLLEKLPGSKGVCKMVGLHLVDATGSSETITWQLAVPPRITESYDGSHETCITFLLLFHNQSYHAIGHHLDLVSVEFREVESLGSQVDRFLDGGRGENYGTDISMHGPRILRHPRPC